MLISDFTFVWFEEQMKKLARERILLAYADIRKISFEWCFFE